MWIFCNKYRNINKRWSLFGQQAVLLYISCWASSSRLDTKRYSVFFGLANTTSDNLNDFIPSCWKLQLYTCIAKNGMSHFEPSSFWRHQNHNGQARAQFSYSSEFYWLTAKGGDAVSDAGRISAKCKNPTRFSKQHKRCTPFRPPPPQLRWYS